MRSTLIGVAVLNDGRPHVIEQNEADNTRIAHQWADVIRQGVRCVDGTQPEVVVGSKW
jgi:hypothetical protein